MESPFASVMERKRVFDPYLAEQMDKEDRLVKHLRKKICAHENAFVRTLEEVGRIVGKRIVSPCRPGKNHCRACLKAQAG